jgi:adenylyltransferase/sulfurtransferase
VNHEELRRYSRQILLSEIGLQGQQRLREKSVLIVGLGGLGSPVALYLAGAGVGRLGLSEFDQLEPHNLQRQTLYTTDGVGRPKLDLALERLRAVNPGVVLEAHSKLEPGTAANVIAGYDLIVDATDNFATRYMISDACVKLQKRWVWGAAVRWDGMVSVFDAQLSLRDAFPNPPEQTDDCDTLGVFGPLLSVIGGVMAGETLKTLLGLETLYGRLWLFDAFEASARTVKLKRA